MGGGGGGGGGGGAAADCNLNVTIYFSPTVNPVTVTVTTEAFSSVAAPRLFKALAIHDHEQIPRAAPKAVENFKIIQGNGGPGTIKHVHFPQDSQFKFAVLKVDESDTTNMTYRYTVVEGDFLMDRYEKVVYEMKLEARPEGGTTVRNVSTYHVKPGVEIKEEEIMTAGEASVVAVFRAVEAYLLAHPLELA